MVEGSSSVGSVASTGELPAIDACLTSAFFEDPLWGTWAFPDAASRQERLRRLMHAWSSAAVGHRWTWTTESTEALTIWLPPGEPEMTAAQETAFEQLIADLFGRRAGELNELFGLFDQHHPRDEPHYYLSLWATHRDHARRGLGSALMRENLALIDAERMPAYVESSNPVNVPIYEVLGFRRKAQFHVADGPVITTMWREARSPG
jgi:ribosomal protein S18 acetylase RimI-like enzyme